MADQKALNPLHYPGTSSRSSHKSNTNGPPRHPQISSRVHIGATQRPHLRPTGAPRNTPSPQQRKPYRDIHRTTTADGPHHWNHPPQLYWKKNTKAETGEQTRAESKQIRIVQSHAAAMPTDRNYGGRATLRQESTARRSKTAATMRNPGDRPSARSMAAMNRPTSLAELAERHASRSTLISSPTDQKQPASKSTRAQTYE
jgi:hypothetical protein